MADGKRKILHMVIENKIGMLEQTISKLKNHELKP